MDKVFIVGFGDMGRRVAALYRSRGAAVSGLSRRGMSGEGVRGVAADLDRPETLAGLELTGATVFYFAPPPAAGAHRPAHGRLCRRGGRRPAIAGRLYQHQRRLWRPGR